jgi:hypothetical protein
VTPETIDMLEAYTRARLPIEALGERTAWRDRSIVALRGLKEANPSGPMAVDPEFAPARLGGVGS